MLCVCAHMCVRLGVCVIVCAFGYVCNCVCVCFVRGRVKRFIVYDSLVQMHDQISVRVSYEVC